MRAVLFHMHLCVLVQFFYFHILLDETLFGSHSYTKLFLNFFSFENWQFENVKICNTSIFSLKFFLFMIWRQLPYVGKNFKICIFH